jgi:hypothetical protein
MKTIASATLAFILLASGGTVNAQNPAVADRGREVYQYWCASCHGRGNRFPGTTALQAKYSGKVPGVLEDRTDFAKRTMEWTVRNMKGDAWITLRMKLPFSGKTREAADAEARERQPTPPPCASARRLTVARPSPSPG